MNFDDTTLKLTVINPLVLLRFDYEVDGKLFLLVLKSSTSVSVYFAYVKPPSLQRVLTSF
jgi:hypothetical protein